MVETDGSGHDVDTMEPAATIVLSAATNEHSAAATAATVGELTATSVDTDKQNETAETTAAATVTADILSAASAFITEAATLPTDNSEDTLNAENEEQTVAAITEQPGLAAAKASVVQDDKAAPETNSHTAAVGSGGGEDINSEIKAPEKSDETAATAATAVMVENIEKNIATPIQMDSSE